MNEWRNEGINEWRNKWMKERVRCLIRIIKIPVKIWRNGSSYDLMRSKRCFVNRPLKAGIRHQWNTHKYPQLCSVSSKMFPLKLIWMQLNSTETHSNKSAELAFSWWYATDPFSQSCHNRVITAFPNKLHDMSSDANIIIYIKNCTARMSAVWLLWVI